MVTWLWNEKRIFNSNGETESHFSARLLRLKNHINTNNPQRRCFWILKDSCWNEVYSFALIVLLQKKEAVGFSVDPQADRTFQFLDHHLMESIKLGDPKVHEFLRVLALCHTVMSEENSAGKCKVRMRDEPFF